MTTIAITAAMMTTITTAAAATAALSATLTAITNQCFNSYASCCYNNSRSSDFNKISNSINALLLQIMTTTKTVITITVMATKVTRIITAAATTTGEQKLEKVCWISGLA